MTNGQHEELADTLNATRGKVALSNYDCDLMTRLYPQKRWKKLHFERTNHSTKDVRTETLWLNYDPYESQNEMRLSL